MSEGSVYRRKDGRYCAKWKDASGKWRYLYRKTKGEAKQALREALKDRDDGIIPAEALTLAQALDNWLEGMQDNVSRRTYVNRESLVRIHIKGHAVGSRKLCRLTPDHLRMFYREKVAQGLAPATVGRLHDVIKMACKEAVRSKHIRDNPAEHVRPPKNRARDMEVLTPAQVKHLFNVVRGSRYEGIIVLGACCALRIGEALSIRYEDLDMEAGTISVHRTLWKGKTYPPKTPQSRRTLKLPGIALEALTRHCEAHGNPKTGYLFQTCNGTPIAAENFWRFGWKYALRDAGLDEGLHYHDLRHGVASLLLSRNVPIPVISRYLSHSNPNTTMRVYAHMIDGMGGMAADGIDDALG